MNLVRHAVISTLFAMAGSLALYGDSWAQTPVSLATGNAREPVIITAASGKVALPPSHAVLTILVRTRSKTAALASTANSRAQANVLDTLQALGYGRQRVESADYSVRRKLDYDTDTLIDYEASLELRVRVDSLATLGSIVDAALKVGGSEIGNLDFFADSVDLGRKRALGEAMRRAQHEAASLAEAAGGRLGKLLEVSTIPPVSGPSGSLTLLPGLIGGNYLLVHPNSVEIEAKVYTRWALERP